MTDHTIDELIELAEGPEGPGSETAFLLQRSSYRLKLEECSIDWIWELTKVGAEREAAMVLMEEALPGWLHTMNWNGEAHSVRLFKRLPLHDKEVHPLSSHDDLARAILIAILRAWKQKEAG